MVDANEFLEMCKLRFAEAQRRFALAQQSLQRAQQEFGAAQVEFNNWQGVLASEMRRLGIATQQVQTAQQQALAQAAASRNLQAFQTAQSAHLAAQAAAQANRLSRPMPSQVRVPPQAPAPATVQPVTQEKPAEPAAPASPPPVVVELEPTSTDNKTELVRELLAHHPEGMTPAEVWNALRNQVARAYVYSILKRLKDADEVIYLRRRKKYSLRVVSKSEEAGKESIVQ